MIKSCFAIYGLIFSKSAKFTNLQISKINIAIEEWLKQIEFHFWCLISLVKEARAVGSGNAVKSQRPKIRQRLALLFSIGNALNTLILGDFQEPCVDTRQCYQIWYPLERSTFTRVSKTPLDSNCNSYVKKNCILWSYPFFLIFHWTLRRN